MGGGRWEELYFLSPLTDIVFFRRSRRDQVTWTFCTRVVLLGRPSKIPAVDTGRRQLHVLLASVNTGEVFMVYHRWPPSRPPVVPWWVCFAVLGDQPEASCMLASARPPSHTPGFPLYFQFHGENLGKYQGHLTSNGPDGSSLGSLPVKFRAGRDSERDEKMMSRKNWRKILCLQRSPGTPP